MTPETRILTPREMEVVRLFIAGYTINHMALLLGVLPCTIWRHKENAARKMGATSSPMLVALVVARGVVTIEEVYEILSASPNIHPFALTEEAPTN